MKKTLSILLTLMMLVGMIVIGTISASAEVKTTDAAFTDNYVLLDYIQNTNGQYIKTGYKAGAKVTVSMDMEITNWKSEWSGIFGSRTADPSTDAFIAYRNEGNNSAYTKIGKANATEYSSLTLNTRTTLSLSGNSNFSGTGVELTLFGINNNGTCDAKGAAVYKLYSCKITDNGEVKRDFVPAQRKSDSAVGLYDLQNGVFYQSASGTGFAMTQKHTSHAFGRNGKCTCGKEFSLDDYQQKNISTDYSNSVTFPGAKKIMFLAEAHVNMTLRDKNGQNTTFAANQTSVVTVTGDTLSISAPRFIHQTYGNSPKPETAFVLQHIVPVFDENSVEVVAPGCNEQGYSCYSYAGQQAKFDYTEPVGHTFDENGKCIHCNNDFSKLSANGSGNLAFGNKICFKGADKIIVTTCAIGFSSSQYAAGTLSLTDGNGNVTTSWVEITKDNKPDVVIDGDNVSVSYSGSSKSKIFFEFFPIYNANKTTQNGNVVYTYAGQSHTMTGAATGSVLSEGNLWIVIVVAVLVVLGVAALFILKKKKKPIAANGANTEDEE